MIPKIIHYCWYGENELSILAKKCIESWKKYFPEWEIKRWDETNSPMNMKYMQTAYNNKKWANLSNLTRLYALKTEGGIYFDTDVEVVKTFDFLDKYSCFIGFESEKTGNDLSINNAVLGAVSNHPYLHECFNYVIDNFDGMEDAYLSSPDVSTKILLQWGLKYNVEQDINNVHVFSREKFYPYGWDDIFSFSCITNDTYTIHFWSLSWKDKTSELINVINENKILKIKLGKYEELNSFIENGNITFKSIIKISFYYIKNKLKSLKGIK